MKIKKIDPKVVQKRMKQAIEERNLTAWEVGVFAFGTMDEKTNGIDSVVKNRANTRTLNKISGKRPLFISDIFNFANNYNYSVTYLLGFSDKKNPVTPYEFDEEKFKTKIQKFLSRLEIPKKVFGKFITEKKDASATNYCLACDSFFSGQKKITIEILNQISEMKEQSVLDLLEISK